YSGTYIERYGEVIRKSLLSAGNGEGWKNIKSAPKDGTKILIPDNGGTVVYWEKDGNENQCGKAAWTNGYFDSHYEQNFVFQPKLYMEIKLPPPAARGE